MRLRIDLRKKSEWDIIVPGRRYVRQKPAAGQCEKNDMILCRTEKIRPVFLLRCMVQ